MTSIVIMSTIGTTFSSALVALWPLAILPPRIFDFSNRFAGRLPGVTMAIGSGSAHGDGHEAGTRRDASITWTRSP